MHSLYIPRTGSLKATITQPDGTERVLGFFSPGDTIGLAELDQKAWTHTFIALEDTWGCEIPVGALDDSLMYRIIRLMGSRLQEEYAAHQTLAMKTGPGRVASFLLQMSAQIKPREQVTRQLHLPMPYSDIADYLGMRSESLSRILNKFLKQRIILKSRRFIDLIDIDSLRQMSK